MEFDGKIAIVTGATSGIGMATALGLADQGAQVAAVGVLATLLGRAREGRGAVVGTAQSDVALVHLLEADLPGPAERLAALHCNDSLCVYAL